MSSAGDGGNSEGGVTSGEPRRYFCHQCNRTVCVSPSSSDLVCPNCNGGFLEELENPIPNPNLNPNNPFFSFTSDPHAAGTAGFPLVFPGAGGAGGGQPFDDLSALFGNQSSPSPLPFGDAIRAPDAFNPLVFLQNYVQTLRAGGANVQFVIENSGDPGGTFQFPRNVNHGDYFFGPGLEELIQQLSENDPTRRGTPPASKSAVDGLPDILVTEELLGSDSAQCAVCKDTFGLGATSKQMPCKHIYHADCILPWLELHNSCPVCRYELPTDDSNYEQRRDHRSVRGGGGIVPSQLNSAMEAGGSADSSAAAAAAGGGRGGGDNTNAPWMRFRVPWPFRQSASSVAETSNVGTANSNNSENSSGPSNPESRGNQDFESETRQEDLD